MQHELAAAGTAVGRSDRCLHPELVGAASLALADAFDLGRVERVELEAALTLLLGADLAGRASGSWNTSSRPEPTTLRAMSRMMRPAESAAGAALADID